MYMYMVYMYLDFAIPYWQSYIYINIDLGLTPVHFLSSQ